ncbi:MAG: glycosyltransferase family 39 protein [Methanobacteriaceae archaeon]|nr:glycosyltransferase family 39 protein [Methanobacteriaceae archaeon]
MDIANYKVIASLSGVDIIKFFKEKYWLIILIAIFLFSFALDIFVLTRYSFSYGIDGAFYDIQIRNIMQYGFPMSNDPPLAYYLLAPFAFLSGNSFLGIKIGMSLIGSLLAFPAFKLTELYRREKNGKILGSRIPALLSAFMVTINVNYFALIGNYMQNLVGVLFLSIFFYYVIKWFEDIENWKKYGALTILFLGINLLTHIYTGALAVTIFFSLLIFSIVLKTYNTRKLPLFDLKILGLLSLLILGCFIILFVAYPVMYTKYGTVLSFLNSSSTITTGGHGMSSPVNGMIFCSLPYLLGVAASLLILYRGLKEIISNESQINNSSQMKININTLLAWVYISFAAVVTVLAVMPASDYQSRFLLIAFLPLGLIIPIGLKFMETEFLARYPSKKLPTTLLVIGIAIIFAFSSFYTASQSFNNLGPTITTDEYNDLVKIRASFVNNSDENIVILASDFQTKYWVEYILGDLGQGKNVNVVENINGVQEKYQNSTLYAISSLNTQTSSIKTFNTASGTSTLNQGNIVSNSGNTISNQGNMPSDPMNAGSNPGNRVRNMGGGGMDNSYDLSFLLPYGPPLLPNSWDSILINNRGSTAMQNPLNRDNQHPEKNNNTTNRSPGNMTSNAAPPENMASNNIQPDGGMPGSRNQTQGAPINNIGSGSDGESLKFLESLTSSGTTIYSGKYFKIIKIKL